MYRTSERAFAWMVDTYGRTLAVALRFRAVTLVVLLELAIVFWRSS